MSGTFSGKINRWLRLAMLILLVMVLFTLPMMLGVTYSGRSESPEHYLVYTQGKLLWDNDTNVDENGVAEMSLFEALYDNVVSEDGAKVIAPGTEGNSIVRLSNNVSGSIDYIAVLYRISSSDELPMKADLVAADSEVADLFYLPEGVGMQHVLRTLKGTVKGGEIQDFDVSWSWDYDHSAAQDSTDTSLGMKAEADDVTVGLYIVVVDNNKYIHPQTGDTGELGTYLALSLICLAVLSVLVYLWYRERKCRQ